MDKIKLLALFYVPVLTFYEGELTGKYPDAPDRSGKLMIEGRVRYVAQDEVFHSLELGDWVKLACARSCYVWEVRK